MNEDNNNVEKPQHYLHGSIEAIDYMKDNMSPVAYHGYLEGSIKKYLHRYRYKGKPVEDLKKAQWYLNRFIEELDGEASYDKGEAYLGEHEDSPDLELSEDEEQQAWDFTNDPKVIATVLDEKAWSDFFDACNYEGKPFEGSVYHGICPPKTYDTKGYKRP